MNFLKRLFAARPPPPAKRPPPDHTLFTPNPASVNYRVLYFAFRQDENWRWRVSITNDGVDDLNPTGWASIEALEADLPRVVSEYYELLGAYIVCFASYHPRTRSMLILRRPKGTGSWQERDKLYAETVRDMIDDAIKAPRRVK